MQKTIRAYINQGRIVADCPECNGAEFVKPGGWFLCMNCHPELRGTKTVVVDGYKIPVTDPVAQQAARDRLIADGIFPQRRWGLPADVAGVVSAFARGDLDYSTGVAIDVSGGFQLKRL